MGIRFDPRFVALAAALLGAAFFVPPLARNAVIALAIAAFVLAPLPRGTRGVVFAVMVGLATGIASINLFAVGIFQIPVTRELGWSQSQYSAVIFIGTLVTVASSLYVGRLFDRRGVRRFAIWSIVLLAAALISLYWLTPNLWHFYGVFALVPLIGAGTSSIAYSRVVARWFDRRRGQAFGAALAGIGIGGAVLSAFSQYLIGEVGWRSAYVGLGLLSLLVTLPVVLVSLRDSPADVGLGLDGEPAGKLHELPADSPQASGSHEKSGRGVHGYTAQESRRLPRFWTMMLAFLVLAFALGGVMLQLVPILRSRGVSAEDAAGIQGALGLALILGRAFAGFLMDRMFAPYVAAAIIVFPIAGAALLANGASGTDALVAAVFIGLAAGAELDVIAYLVTRYFGTRGYAENYGWLYAAWTLGSGTAPVLTAYVFDVTGTHTAILWAYAALFAVSAALVLRLGPYPNLASARKAEAAAPAP